MRDAYGKYKTTGGVNPVRYYIGIDGGGTKTAICALSEDLSDIRYSKTGGASWREHGMETVVQRLSSAVNELIPNEAGSITAIAMGLPCYGESVEGDKLLLESVTAAFAPAQIYLTNDVEVGWAGSMALEAGINVVAGTGSIAYGHDRKGNTARSGGWDEFYSDEGSCYWMGRRLMEMFTKQSDGRIPKGPLYDIVRRELGITDDLSFIDHMREHYLGHRKKVASLQLLAEEAALAGDKSILELYEQAVKELVMLAMAVRNNLEFETENWEVSYSGGLFRAAGLVVPAFQSEIERFGGKLVEARCTPEQGAVLLAFKHFSPQALPDVKGQFAL